MSQGAGIAVLVAVVVLAFAGMWWGWRRRVARASSAVPALPAVPELGTPTVGPVAATYLASVPADDRLARVAAHRLGVRSPAEVEVHGAGVLVRRAGAGDLFVPAADLVRVDRASGFAGTAVAVDRVLVLRWRCAAVTLDTGVLARHAADRAALAAAVAALVPAGPTTEGSPA